MDIDQLKEKIRKVWEPYFDKVQVVDTHEKFEDKLEAKLHPFHIEACGRTKNYVAKYIYDPFELYGVRPEILDYIIYKPLEGIENIIEEVKNPVESLSPGRR